MLISTLTGKIVVGNQEIETTDIVVEMTFDPLALYRDALFQQALGLFRRQRELHGEWLTREESTLPERLAEQYHTECDAYDAGICTGNRNGEPIPVTSQEHGLINRNAYQVRRRLLAEHPGVTPEALHQAIQRGCK